MIRSRAVQGAKNLVLEATLSTWRKMAPQEKEQAGNPSRFFDELKVCGNTKNLRRGKNIHAEIIKHGNVSCIYLVPALIHMYAKCGRMVEARLVFDRTKDPNVVSWNALILGYAANGEGATALDMFARMMSGECAPNCFTFIAALKANTSLALGHNESRRKECLERGRDIHSQIGCHLNNLVQNTLIRMYAKTGSMVEACHVFNSIKKPDRASYNALILGYAENGEGVTALKLLETMKSQGCVPDSFTFVAALKACTSLADGNRKGECLQRGRQIHSQIGCLSHIYVKNALIGMYAKCGSMADAHFVFDSIKNPDVVSWTVLILGYAENGKGVMALDLFGRMRSHGCSPDYFTFAAALKACISLAMSEDGSGRDVCLEQGKQIHSAMGSRLPIYAQSTLIDMYAKCGSMVDAHQVFDSIKEPDVVSWTTLILGYAENGNGMAALDLFEKMKFQGCAPDSMTFVAALKACTSLAMGQNIKQCLDHANQIRAEIGIHSTIYVQSTLMDMYAKCGKMVDARHVFDRIEQPDVVAWSALILGYAENGEGLIALDLFSRMRMQGFVPDSFTFVAALKACTSLALDQEIAECLCRGRQLQSEIGSHSHTFVQNSLIDMYAKCGSMAEAWSVFDNMKHPDVVSWNALILGYAENGDSVVALNMFAKMKSQGFAPNSLTFAAALKACSSLGALETGSKIHAELDTAACNTVFVTCLVDLYVKCGKMMKAQEAFDTHLTTRDLTTWTALLAGYSRLGDMNTVFYVFEGMQDAGFQPNGVTFLCILTCCSHAGFIEKAWEVFEAMSTKYGTTPTVEHYNCMIDILGRSNKLDDSIALLQSMRCNPDGVTWMTLLGACRKWKNVGLGRLSFKSLDHTNAAAYVLMAQIYGSKSMWAEQERMLTLSK